MLRALTIACCLPFVACQTILGFEEFHGANDDDLRGADGGVAGASGSGPGMSAAGAGAGHAGGSGSSGSGSGGSGSGAGADGSEAGGGSGSGASGSGSGGTGEDDDPADAGDDAAAGCSGADCTEDCDGVEGGDAVLDACGACDDDESNDCPDVASNGLVAEWRFDQSSGASVLTTARSSCGSACTATLLNFADTSGRDVDTSSGWVAEPDVVGGGALRLDGANDYLEIPDSDQLIHGWNAFTIELLVKLDDLSSDCALWSSQDPGGGAGTGNAFGSYVEASGTVSGNAYGATLGCDADTGPCQEVQSMTPIAAGAWRQLAFVLSSGEVALFVDAVDKTDVWSSVGSLTSIANPTVAHRIGAFFSDGSANMPFDGEMAVVRVYDRALSSTELADNLDAELP